MAVHRQRFAAGQRADAVPVVLTAFVLRIELSREIAVGALLREHPRHRAFDVVLVLSDARRMSRAEERERRQSGDAWHILAAHPRTAAVPVFLVAQEFVDFPVAVSFLVVR